MKNPTVSVILPIYNGAEFIEGSIQSILAQDFRDFELLAIDDGSTDDTPKILRRLAKKDPRIRILTHAKNMGLVAGLNEGIEEAKGRFIARMDADDYAMATRFSRQVAALKKDSSIALVAGGFRIIKHDDTIVDHIYPYLLSEDLHRRLFIGNAIAHGSVMMRKSAVKKAGLYSGDVGPTEDYELWTRLMKVGRIVAIPHLIYVHRLNPGGISMTLNEKQQKQMIINQQNVWAERRPEIVTRSTLKKRLRFYRAQPYGRQQWSYHYLLDNAQLGVKMVRYGYRMAGFWQLLQVALVGREGVSAVRARIKAIQRD